VERLTVFHLLICYAIAFGIQNKLTFLFNKLDLLDRLLTCTYCLGFHCGWMVWLFDWALEGTPPGEEWYAIPSLIAWGLISATFCYVLDAAVRWLETNSQGE